MSTDNTLPEHRYFPDLSQELKSGEHPRAYGHCAIIKPDPAPKQQGSIILAESARDQETGTVWKGTVISVGKGALRRDEDGDYELEPPDFEVGARVLYNRDSCIPIGGEYTAVRIEAVYGVLDEE